MNSPQNSPDSLLLHPIAHIHTDFPSKFGIPRQSGLIPDLRASVIFEPEYRNPDAFRGLEEFSHLWLIWEFSESKRNNWSPTVRPPRLGGNIRKGVFATRSPFRPNPLGLSCVKLDHIDLHTSLGPVLYVLGADLMDQTPIYDIKPYVPYSDSHPEALGSFADLHKNDLLQVIIPNHWLSAIPTELLKPLKGVLAHDPRPAYQNDPERIYGFPFGNIEIRFTVKENVLTVCEIVDQDVTLE